MHDRAESGGCTGGTRQGSCPCFGAVRQAATRGIGSLLRHLSHGLHALRDQIHQVHIEAQFDHDAT